MCVDTLLKKKKEMTWFYYLGDAPRRYPKKNIFAEYCDLLKVSSYKNNVKLRSCEQELVELDNKDLKDFLQQYVVTPSLSKETCEIHKSCVLLHLIQVFCIPDQEEKKELVQNYLKEWLHILSNEMRYIIFKRYITQQLKTKSILTEIDLLAGQIDQQHEFMLKLCYLDTLCVENNHEGFKELLQQNADFFVSKIEEVVTKFQMTSSKYEKTKVIFCMILLSILNWKLYNQKTTSTSTLKNTETQASPIVTLKPIKYLCTAHKIRSILQSLLSTLHADEILTAFNAYLDQMYAMKSEITEDGLCISETESHLEFQLKLCYWTTICRKNDNEAYKKFIQLYPEFLVSHIEENVQLYEPKTKLYFCKTLLCILNWQICTLKTAPLMVQNTKIQASQSVAIGEDSSTKTIRRILQTVLSTLSEEEIFAAFNEYLDQMHTSKSEITEDDFCTGYIEPFHEFMLKLCYCEKLCNEHNDDETYRKFLRRNADFLVPQIEEVVDGNNTKTKLISCKVLLCLVKWDICHQKTAYTPLNNILSQMLTQKEDCQDFMNENALFFVSMVHTVIKRNNTPLLINLCDVLLCIPYSELHFYEVTGAVNKLIRYHARQVGINKKTLQWVLLLGYSFLKHLNDNQKIDTARKTKIDFQKFCNLLKELFTDSLLERKALDLLIEAFKDNTYPCHGNQNKYCNHLRDFIKEQDAIKQRDSCKGEQKAMQSSYSSLMFAYSEYSTPLEGNFFNEWNDINTKYSRSLMLEPYSFTRLVGNFPLPSWDEDIFNPLPSWDGDIFNMLALILMVYIVWTSAAHHSSAKLEKYLTLKHHYPMASLYLLWCSGDIEVHPGPCNEKKPLVHISSIKRRWIQNVCKMLDIKLSDGVQSKYRAKKGRISDKEHRKHFIDLLKACHEEKVHVPKMFQAEINAWETKEYKLLNKLFVCREEIETIKASLHDFFTCGGSTKDLTYINVSIITELKTNEIAMVLGKDQRPKDKPQLMSHITRYIANISIKCAHGKNPDVKCDGLWDQPLKNLPDDIILFDPNNRGKYGQNLKPDQELVDTLIKLPQITFPPNYKDVVDAYKVFRTSKKEQHKEELCNIFKRTTSLKNLDYALKSLCVNGIFTEEVHNILQIWWTVQTLPTGNNETLSRVNNDETEKKGRPHILIDISTKSITLTVEPKIAHSSQVSYVFPFNDELVKLKTIDTTVRPSSDICKTVTAKKYLKPTPDENPADNIIDSITIPQPTSSTNRFSQTNQNIAISGQPVSILCTNQSTNNSYDLRYLHISANNVSQNLDLYTQVSPTSDMGSSDSISSINSEAGNEEGDQNNTLNGGQILLTDSDYSSDSNCASKISLKKRKSIEEDRNEMKKRKKISLKQDKKQKETNHRKMDSSMDKSTISHTNMKLVMDHYQINFDSFDDQIFDALDNEDKNPKISDKDGNLINGETQMTKKNTNGSAYNTNVSALLAIFIQEMI